MRQFYYRTILAVIFLAIPLLSAAQQIPLYSEYLFNTLEINPAYAGIRESMQVTTMFRKQWTGFRSAPQSTFLSADFPVPSKRIGLGMKLVDDRDEISRSFGVQTAYSFRIPTGENSSLSFGLQAGVLSFKSDYSDVDVIEPDDPVFQENVNTFRANFGTGIYYHTRAFYAGLSSPNLIRNDLRDPGSADDNNGQQHIQVYFNTGYVFSTGGNIHIKPSVLLRAMTGKQTLNLDLNANIWMADMVGFGLSYRTEGAMVGMLDVRLLPDFHLGYAYDHRISRLNIISKGSHELILRYEIPFQKLPQSARYF